MGCTASCVVAGDGAVQTIQRIDDIDGKGVSPKIPLNPCQAATDHHPSQIQVAFFFTIFAAIVASALILILNRIDNTPRRQALLTGLRRLLLSLSDQQLITGLAMCATAYLRICDIQVWNFLVAWHMATLSFAVHCLTLFTLRDHFHDALVRDSRRSSRVPAWLRLPLVLLNMLAILPATVHVAIFEGRPKNSELMSLKAACLLVPEWLHGAAAPGIVGFVMSVALAVGASVLLGVYVFGEVPSADSPRTLKRFLPHLTSFLVFCATALMLGTTGNLVWGPAIPGPEFEEDDDGWGFGQILAIFLLLLTGLQVWPIDVDGSPPARTAVPQGAYTNDTELLPIYNAFGASEGNVSNRSF